MLTLRFTSSCFARSFFFPFLIVSLLLLLLLLWRRSSHPLCVIRVTVLFFVVFYFSLYTVFWALWSASRQPFRPDD